MWPGSVYKKWRLLSQWKLQRTLATFLCFAQRGCGQRAPQFSILIEKAPLDCWRPERMRSIQFRAIQTQISCNTRAWVCTPHPVNQLPRKVYKMANKHLIGWQIIGDARLSKTLVLLFLPLDHDWIPGAHGLFALLYNLVVKRFQKIWYRSLSDSYVTFQLGLALWTRCRNEKWHVVCKLFHHHEYLD